MNHRNLIWMVLSFCLGLVAVARVAESQEPSAAETGFAVVELFTSQGCSSCPPADRVLAKLTEQNSNSSQESPAVYALSFHVDYWNRLGWDDPYSSELSTRRQQAYARVWDSRRVYTPQMVVNGQDEFVGSHGKRAQQSIDEALSQKRTTSITLNAKATSTDAASGSIELQYQVTGRADGSVLNVALVSNQVSNKVPRGENRGRSLQHVNVVRAFEVVDLADGIVGSVTLDTPADFDGTSGKVIAYVQQRDDAVITGAAAIKLP